LTYVIELTGSLREKAGKKTKPEEIPAFYGSGSEYKTSLFVASFKALYESIKELFSQFSKKSAGPAAEDALSVAEPSAADLPEEPEPEKESGISITDFDASGNRINPEFIENIENSDDDDSEEML
jgi:hypothetical protein